MANTFGLTRKKLFEVNGIAYVIEYSDQEFLLYVDRYKSKKQVIDHNEIDPFRGFHFYEVTDQYLSNASDYLKTSNPIRVYREVMEFVREIIGSHRPYMFQYSANEDIKRKLYARVAKRVADKFGYYLIQNGNHFTFYRLAA